MTVPGDPALLSTPATVAGRAGVVAGVHPPTVLLLVGVLCVAGLGPLAPASSSAGTGRSRHRGAEVACACPAVTLMPPVDDGPLDLHQAGKRFTGRRATSC